jgi:PAS domain S-box-containing protein
VAQRLREAEYHHARLALAVEATALGLWEWDAQTGRTYWSPRQREIFGLPSGQEPTYEFWASALHPEDKDRVIQSVSELMNPQSGGQLELEHRVVHPTGEVRWVLSRGQMTYEEVDGHLTPTRLLGTVLDITSRKQAEEERQLLLRETNHRVLNLFAMTSSMIAMTARSSRSPAEMADRLSGRIGALARAHELIRPALVSEDLAQPPTSLHDLITIVLAPHTDTTGRRLLASGPDVPVGSKAATALTLVFHELATNAAKYGALSVDGGRVEITWHLEGDHVQVHWRESGGPAVTAAPQRQGFGTRLLRGSLNQLAGEISYEWALSGLACIIRFARKRIIL